jgi:hypothetical protein
MRPGERAVQGIRDNTLMHEDPSKRSLSGTGRGSTNEVGISWIFLRKGRLFQAMAIDGLDER